MSDFKLFDAQAPITPARLVSMLLLSVRLASQGAAKPVKDPN
jgi:hypothetical protein